MNLLWIDITAGNPLIIGISANDLKARQKTEIALRAVMFWASIDHIVGVSENLKKGANVLVVRIQGDKDAKWSDGAKQRELECGYGNRTDCDGVPVRDPNSSDFQADQDAVDTRVIGSYVLYSVGGLLTASGSIASSPTNRKKLGFPFHRSYRPITSAFNYILDFKRTKLLEGPSLLYFP